jgi:hypothetical protein
LLHFNFTISVHRVGVFLVLDLSPPGPAAGSAPFTCTGRSNFLLLMSNLIHRERCTVMQLIKMPRSKKVKLRPKMTLYYIITFAHSHAPTLGIRRETGMASRSSRYNFKRIGNLGVFSAMSFSFMRRIKRRTKKYKKRYVLSSVLRTFPHSHAPSPIFPLKPHVSSCQ